MCITFTISLNLLQLLTPHLLWLWVSKHLSLSAVLHVLSPILTLTFVCPELLWHCLLEDCQNSIALKDFKRVHIFLHKLCMWLCCIQAPLVLPEIINCHLYKARNSPVNANTCLCFIDSLLTFVVLAYMPCLLLGLWTRMMYTIVILSANIFHLENSAMTMKGTYTKYMLLCWNYLQMYIQHAG